MAQWTDPHVVLSVSRGIDVDELRRAYRSALLQYHPDKAGRAAAEGTTAVENSAPKYTIDDVNRAYEMLRDRGSGNSAVDAGDAVVNFNEVCDLGTFVEREAADGSMEWVRDCRCGEQGYRLSEVDLESNGDADEIAVQCAGCSLWILVQYAVE